MKVFNNGISNALIIIAVILFGISNITLIGTVIYDILKTDMSFWSIICDAVINWLVTALSATFALILAIFISED